MSMSVNALLKEMRRAKREQWEDLLAGQIKMAGVPEPLRQYHALVETGTALDAMLRDFRWDFAWPEYRLLLEVDGGIYVNGEHNRAKGIQRDCEKQSLAASQGWRTLRVTPDQVEDLRALGWVEAALRWSA